MDLHPDLTDLLSEFENSGVEYLVVGGWAVATHGTPRFTKDIDLLIGSSPTNLERVVAALAAFGAPPQLLEAARSMGPEEFLFFGTPPARVDLLRQVPGVDFDEAWTRRLDAMWNGRTVHVLGLDDLIASKKAAGRTKDLVDARALEKLRLQGR